MAQLISLSDEDLAQLRAELAGGRPPMVWFTSAAVGVPAGGSAKIVAFADPAEGDFVQVRPTGSKDALSFSPSELTRTRPPRKRVTAGRVPAKAAPKPKPTAPSPPLAPPAQPPEIRPTEARPPAARPPATRPAAAPPRRAPVRPVAAAEVTIILASTEAGDWTVEVLVGKKRAVRAIPVSPAEVARAAKALPAQVAEAVDRALDSARRQQQARVAQLEAELAKAQRALKDLS